MNTSNFFLASQQLSRTGIRGLVIQNMLWHCFLTSCCTWRQLNNGQERCADLHRVYSNVDAAFEKGIINLLGEQPLPANVCQWLIQDLVTGGLDDADLQGALFLEVWEGSLQRCSTAFEISQEQLCMLQITGV